MAAVDKHLTELSENLHKVVGNACKTYIEDAAIKLKLDVYRKFSPADPDDTAGAMSRSADNTLTCGDKTAWNTAPCTPSTITFTNGKIVPLMRAGEAPAIEFAKWKTYPITGYTLSRGGVRVIVTNLGNLYYQNIVEHGNGRVICPPEVSIESFKYTTDTPLSPVFESILANAVSCIGIGSDSAGIKNILNMNCKYYYLLAENPGAEIACRERELRERAAEFERALENERNDHGSTLILVDELRKSLHAANDIAAKFAAELDVESEKYRAADTLAAKLAVKLDEERERRRTAEAELANIKEKMRQLIG